MGTTCRTWPRWSWAERSFAVKGSWPLARSPGIREAVADAVHGVDEAGLGGMVAQLVAEPLDVHVHGAGGAHVVVAPHVPQEFLPGEGAAWAAGQKVEQIEFLEGERQRLSVQRRPAPIAVDDQGSPPDGIAWAANGRPPRSWP